MVLQWRVAGGIRLHATRSFIEPVSGPQAAVWASRTASSSEAAEAVAVPCLPWYSTATLHWTCWLARVDQSRKATNPAMTSRVTVLARALMGQEPPRTV